MAEYSIFMQYDPQDKIYVASVPELQGCMAHGETKEEALKEIEIAKELWIETAKEDGLPIPEPALFTSVAVQMEVIKISPVSDAKKRANKKWQDANCKRVQLVIPNEEAEIIENYCSEKNISKNGFFREAAKEKIEREKQIRSIFLP